MTIGFLTQILVKREDIIHQTQLKLLYIFPLSLAAHELTPRFEEIFERDDILVPMRELDTGHGFKPTPPPRAILPVLERAKSAYVLWSQYHSTLPKTCRYSLGAKIDTLFIDLIEAMAAAGFLPRNDKHPYVRLAIRKTDTLKVLLMVLWETKSIDTNKYGLLSVKVDEIGKMLGGWNGQLTKTQPRA